MTEAEARDYRDAEQLRRTIAAKSAALPEPAMPFTAEQRLGPVVLPLASPAAA